MRIRNRANESRKNHNFIHYLLLLVGVPRLCVAPFFLLRNGGKEHGYYPHHPHAPNQRQNRRGVYVGYRKAGYSAQYRAAHEPEILLHQAAKKAFDAQKLDKLPTVKSLNAEYAALLAQKKANYAEYRKLRTETRELLTAKANVDALLGREKQPHQKEKSRER